MGYQPPTEGGGDAPASHLPEVSERLVVALVRGVHGLRGRVRAEVLTDRPDERFAVGEVLHPEGSTDSLTIDEASPIADGPGWWLHFREVPDRTAADALRDTYLEAVVGQPPDGVEVYWHELVGIHIRDAAGRELGVIEDVYRVGENEVYVVRGGPLGDFDLPAVRAFIRVFEPRIGEIVVDAEALGLDEAAR